MLSFLLWILVSAWTLLVVGAGYLAWRYYARKEPARRQVARPQTTEVSRGRPRVVLPESG